MSIAKGLSKPALALGKGAATLMLALRDDVRLRCPLLLESPKIRVGRTQHDVKAGKERLGDPGRSRQISRVALGLHAGQLCDFDDRGHRSIFVTLICLSVPFAISSALWVALVDFLPQIGGALAGIPTVLFAFIHSLTAGIITFVVFMVYTQLENHVLNPIVMSRAEKINPLTVFIAILIGAEMGSWVDGIFGGFVGVMLAVPSAATFHVLFREIWNSTRSPAARDPRLE